MHTTISISSEVADLLSAAVDGLKGGDPIAAVTVRALLDEVRQGADIATATAVMRRRTGGQS